MKVLVIICLTLGVITTSLVVSSLSRSSRREEGAIVRSIVPPEPDRASLSAELGAFRHGASTEPVPAEIAELLAFATGQDSDQGDQSVRRGPGPPLPGKTRRLLDGLGSKRAALYAAPTGRGWVCYALTHGIGLKCLPSLIGDAVWTLRFTREGRTATLQLHGIVSDDVNRVMVVTPTATEDAEVANNAFFFERTGGSIHPDDLPRLILEYRDGSRKSIGLGSNA